MKFFKLYLQIYIEEMERCSAESDISELRKHLTFSVMGEKNIDALRAGE